MPVTVPWQPLDQRREREARMQYLRAADRAGRVPALLTGEPERALRVVLGHSPATTAHVARFDRSDAVRRVALLDLAHVAHCEITKALIQQQLPDGAWAVPPPRQPLTFVTRRVIDPRLLLRPPHAAGVEPEVLLADVARRLAVYRLGMTAEGVTDHLPALTERGQQEIQQ